MTANFRQQDTAQTAIQNSAQALKGNVVIAVDGPSASGKGTLAKKIAERLGYAYLDTGALYRAVALATIEIGGDPSNINDVIPALTMVKKYLTPELLSNPELRQEEVSSAASQVAALPEVREQLLEFQREFAKNPPGYVGGAVLDGRDIGTVICPDAHVKFYVTASVEERAKRRFKDVESTGVSYETVLFDLKERDARDQNRAVAPAKAAENAVTIDTTNMNAAEALEEAVNVIRVRFLAEAEGRQNA